MAGVNAAAVASARSGARVYMDVYMSNHGHWLLGGPLAVAEDFFDIWRVCLWNYERSKGMKSDLRRWEAQFSEVEDLTAFRNCSAYIARNGYLAMKDVTPFGYEWCSADLFFNGHLKDLDPGAPYSTLTRDAKRRLCRSSEVELPDGYRVRNGLITRESYIVLPGVEAMFNSGSQYFNKLARNAEADMVISHMIGETIMIPDDEMFAIVAHWARRDLGVEAGLKGLNPDQRIELARRMHNEYNSDNRQIAQILRLPRDAVDRMYRATPRAMPKMG